MKKLPYIQVPLLVFLFSLPVIVILIDSQSNCSFIEIDLNSYQAIIFLLVVTVCGVLVVSGIIGLIKFFKERSERFTFKTNILLFLSILSVAAPLIFYFWIFAFYYLALVTKCLDFRIPF